MDSNSAGTPTVEKADSQPSPGESDSAPRLDTQLGSGSRADRRWRFALILVFGAIVAAYALLWSPWWSPLSDSSLFLSVARNMDEGRGYTYMGRPHRMVMPLTPAMLWGLLQISRSFGLMNAAMIVGMLGSFVFVYLVLGQWLDRRTALMLTAISALTYWQFRLATVIGSDQPFLLLFWMGMYFIVRARQCPQRRLPWLSLAAIVLLLGMGFRLASLLLTPIIGLGLWLDYADRLSFLRRSLLAGAVVLPMLLAGGAYWAWQAGKFSSGPRPRESVPVPKSAPAAATAAAKGTMKEITRYAPRLRIMACPVYQWPAVMGRWLAESLVAPSREAFVRAGFGWEVILCSGIAAIGLVGVWIQFREQRWWLALPILYVLAFVVLWGSRYIPRYMVPVTPMIVLWLSTGAAAIAAQAARLLRIERATETLRRGAMLAVPAVVLAGNLPILAGEIYVYRGGDFHARLRQGGTAELVDAAAAIRRMPKGVVVCTNDAIRRREVHLLTGRPVAVFDGVSIASPRDDRAIRRFFTLTGARCALIRYAAVRYPEWHFSLSGGAPADWSWWGLYVWDARRKRPVRVSLSVDRAWSLRLPDASI